jgi:hypothetical protein
MRETMIERAWEARAVQGKRLSKKEGKGGKEEGANRDASL